MQALMKSGALRMLDCSLNAGAEHYDWLDAEGGSLIGTLRKAWGNDAPEPLAWILSQLVGRIFTTEGDPAAAETAALAVAHLLPVVLR